MCADSSTERPAKRPSFPDRHTTAGQVGRFLMDKFHATQFSRKEAAERAGISEGTLTSMLSGRTAFIAQNVLRRMSAHWGFDVLEYYLAAGLLTHNDIADYLQKQEILPSGASQEMQTLFARLAKLPQSKRDRLVEAFLNTLSTVENTTG